MLLVMIAPPDDQILQLIQRLGIARPADLEAHGIPRGRLYRLVQAGMVERQARGIYIASKHPYTAEHTLAQVAKRVPGGVFCLLTALRFHELTTQAPAEVWIALPEKARKPRLDYPRLRVARFSGAALTEGIETRAILGVPVRVTSPARTVVDCFRYRRKIGLDVALEALRNAVNSRRATVDEIGRVAGVCRARTVMRIYLEAMAV